MLEQSAQPVETTVAPTSQPLPEPERNLAVDLALAYVAGDKGEIVRITELSKAAPEPEKPVEEVAQPTPEEVAAKAEADEVVRQEAEEAADLEKIQSGEQPTGKKSIRPRFSDPEDVAIATLARTQGIPLAEAVRIRAEITGKAKPVEEVHQEPPADPNIITLETEVATIEKEFRDTHKADAMDENLPEIQIRLSRANAKLESSRSKAMALADMRTISKQEAAAQTQAAFNHQVESAKLETAKDFPQMKDPKSPLSILCDAMARDMQDEAHPDHAEIFKPSIIRFLAEKNAAKIGITPASKTPPPVTQKPPEKPVVRPAAGHKGSVPPPPALSAEAAIAALREEATRAIAGGHFAHGKNAGLAGTIIL